jgi:predicted nucleic acid-binding Zn ribbon protein
MGGGNYTKEFFMKNFKILGIIALTALIAGEMWAQDASDSSSANSVAYTVEVTYMTQGGTKRTDSVTVLASDPRAAELEAEAQFRKTDSHSTFIRAAAKVPDAYVQDRPESTGSASSAGRAVSPNPDGKVLYSVEVTYMTQGGTKRTDTITVLSSDPRAAEREAEAQFKKTNSRSTFMRAVVAK